MRPGTGRAGPLAGEPSYRTSTVMLSVEADAFAAGTDEYGAAAGAFHHGRGLEFPLGAGDVVDIVGGVDLVADERGIGSVTRTKPRRGRTAHWRAERRPTSPPQVPAALTTAPGAGNRRRSRHATPRPAPSRRSITELRVVRPRAVRAAPRRLYQSGRRQDRLHLHVLRVVRRRRADRRPNAARGRVSRQMAPAPP